MEQKTHHFWAASALPAETLGCCWSFLQWKSLFIFFPHLVDILFSKPWLLPPGSLYSPVTFCWMLLLSLIILFKLFLSHLKLKLWDGEHGPVYHCVLNSRVGTDWTQTMKKKGSFLSVSQNRKLYSPQNRRTKLNPSCAQVTPQQPVYNFLGSSLPFLLGSSICIYLAIWLCTCQPIGINI